MPSVERAVPPLSIMISWPTDVPARTAVALAQQFAGAHVSSTWAIEDPGQATALQAGSARSGDLRFALLFSNCGQADAAIERGLKSFASAGVELAAIQVTQSLARGSVERRLCQAGVRAVVLRGSNRKAPSVRALPFGVWEIRPHISVPDARRKLSPFRWAGRGAASFDDAVPTVANIDLQRMVSPQSGGWGAAERLIQQAAEASARGAVRIVTIDELAAELSGATTARPQRSILRAAA